MNRSFVAFVGCLLAVVAQADPKDGPVKPGMRWYALKFGPDDALVGFVLPGSRVDVVQSTKDEEGKVKAEIVVANVLVIAVDQPAEAELKAKGIVCTLEVSPQQAEKLAIAKAKGTLKLVLLGAVVIADSAAGGAKTRDIETGPPPSHG